MPSSIFIKAVESDLKLNIMIHRSMKLVKMLHALIQMFKTRPCLSNRRAERLRKMLKNNFIKAVEFKMLHALIKLNCSGNA